MNQPTVADLYEKFREPLRGFISKRISNPHTVEDLVHDVFVRIHGQIGTVKQPERLTAWIYQIARNSIIDFYRKNKEPLMAAVDDNMSFSEEQFSDAAEKLAPALREMVARLPDKYKEALWLADFEDRKYTHIAKQLGISVSGVKSRVQRARDMLKEMLLQCCHVEFDRYGTVFDYSPRKCEQCCESNPC